MINGLILINKQVGLSTTKEEYPLKQIFQTKKVGHLGTLDPFADGLIICGINKGTKLFPLLEDLDKTYIATLQLGTQTNTQDLTGETINQKIPSSHSVEEVKEVLQSCLNIKKQIPPMFSAIKINGEKLYNYARNNVKINVKPRQIQIKEISLLSYYDNQIVFQTTVSKGTYIRTLGEEISTRLNEYGHLIKLTRTKIGQFKLENAKHIKDVTINDIMPIQDVLSDIPRYSINESNKVKFLNGNKIKLNINEHYILVMLKDIPIALYEYNKEDSFYICKQMFY